MEKLIDTNIVIRYLMRDDEKLYEEASKILAWLEKDKIVAYLPEAVIAEIVFILTSVFKVTKLDVVTSLISLFVAYPILKVESYIPKALLIFRDTNFHIVDCILAARANESEILSFDQQLLSFVSKK